MLTPRTPRRENPAHRALAPLGGLAEKQQDHTWRKIPAMARWEIKSVPDAPFPMSIYSVSIRNFESAASVWSTIPDWVLHLDEGTPTSTDMARSLWQNQAGELQSLAGKGFGRTWHPSPTRRSPKGWNAIQSTDSDVKSGLLTILCLSSARRHGLVLIRVPKQGFIWKS